MSKPLYVFISYSHLDAALAHAVADALRGLGVAYFLDEKEIDWGQSISATVESALGRTTHLVVLVSPASQDSQWVAYEIGLARGRGVVILPLLAHPAQKPPPFLRDYLYKSDLADVRRYFSAAVSASPPVVNPKPVCLGRVELESVYIMLGNHTTEMEVEARYAHEPLVLPNEIVSVFPLLAAQAEDRARKDGFPYFNGPTARLVRFTEAGSRSTAAGPELRRITLELGPMSWEEFTVLNTFLDDPVLPGGRTMRDKYADANELFRNDRDFRWCQLSNILCIVMIPMTSDGFGIVCGRNPRGGSVEGDSLTSGIAENIHRYLDEAPGGRMEVRLHALRLPGDIKDSEDGKSTYAPMGVPSPLLTAQRGLWEELSEELAARVPLRSYRFLNLCFSLHRFQPVLAGVVELGHTRVEVERFRNESPGRDHSEVSTMQYVRLDADDPETAAILSQRDRWVPAGLAALISAIGYWQARSR